MTQVWTSTLKRTIQTGSKLPYPKLTWKSLDELDAGAMPSQHRPVIEVLISWRGLRWYDIRGKHKFQLLKCRSDSVGLQGNWGAAGCLLEKFLNDNDVQQAYPDDFANRDEDKFNYRYRGGESYRDVVVRLEPVIMELERQENILIIGHQVSLWYTIHVLLVVLWQAILRCL